MRIKTLAAYLVGDREAILRVAGDRSAIAVGAHFVLSAAFAREYDGVDLRREPWRLALPFAASLVMAALIFLAVRFGLTPHGLRDSDYAHSFRAFLGCFWMTAPLAWLYAVPYERFLSQGDAARANLITLGIVALWRVLLITRVSAILSSRRFVAALFVVMFIADAALLLALNSSPVPLLQVMGGIRLTDAESVILGWTLLIKVVAVLTMLIWFAGSATVIFRSTHSTHTSPPIPPAGTSSSGTGVCWLALASMAIWVPLAPGPQREQRRAADVDQLLHSGKLSDAIAKMSSQPRSDFPPAWEPAPRIGYGESDPSLLDVLDVIARDGAAPWVRAEYLGKLDRELYDPFYLYLDGSQDQKQTWSRTTGILNEIPEGNQLRATHADRIKYIEEDLRSAEPTTHPATVP